LLWAVILCCSCYSLLWAVIHESIFRRLETPGSPVPSYQLFLKIKAPLHHRLTSSLGSLSKPTTPINSLVYPLSWPHNVFSCSLLWTVSLLSFADLCSYVLCSLVGLLFCGLTPHTAS
jgi:hypothetical protein